MTTPPTTGYTTNNAGIPVASDDESLTVGSQLGTKVEDGVRAGLAETEPAAGPSPVPAGSEAARV